MTELNWRNESSFSRGETDRTPRSWALDAGALKLSVHRHIHYPGAWLLSVRGMGAIDLRVLKSQDVEAAKAEAVGIVTAALRAALQALEGA